MLEEFLEGEEASLFVLTDGHALLPFGSAQDHKRVGEGDTGPNTGGMGAYSPAPVLTPDLEERAIAEIVAPTVKAMREEGMPFSGVLYAGLMLTRTGPKLIEYNARFGDPECQVLMMRFQGDLLAVMLATAEGRLAMLGDIALSDDTAMTVVLAAAGYPAPPRPAARSAASMRRKRPARSSSRRARSSPAIRWQRPAAASWPSPPPAPTSAPPATRPIAASTPSISPTASAAATSAGANWRDKARARHPRHTHTHTVIPAKAGIQTRYPRASSRNVRGMDSRLRGNDDEGDGSGRQKKARRIAPTGLSHYRTKYQKLIVVPIAMLRPSES